MLHRALNRNRRERRRKEDRTMIIKERRQVQYVPVSPVLSRMRQEGSVAGQPGRQLLLRHGSINSCGRGQCESLSREMGQWELGYEQQKQEKK